MGRVKAHGWKLKQGEENGVPGTPYLTPSLGVPGTPYLTPSLGLGSARRPFGISCGS